MKKDRVASLGQNTEEENITVFWEMLWWQRRDCDPWNAFFKCCSCGGADHQCWHISHDHCVVRMCWHKRSNKNIPFTIYHRCACYTGRHNDDINATQSSIVPRVIWTMILFQWQKIFWTSSYCERIIDFVPIVSKIQTYSYYGKFTILILSWTKIQMLFYSELKSEIVLIVKLVFQWCLTFQFQSNFDWKTNWCTKNDNSRNIFSRKALSLDLTSWWCSER